MGVILGMRIGSRWLRDDDAPSSGVPRGMNGSLCVLVVGIAVGLLAGCGHDGARPGQQSVVPSSIPGHAAGATSVLTKNARDRPVWEQPELLAKYPVRAKRNPDGSYDYSDPKFENADLCKDIPPEFWKKRGYRVIGSEHSNSSTLKDCIVDDGDGDLSKAMTIGTEKRRRKDVVGRLVKQYRPGRFDQLVDSLDLPACIAYLETDIGRIGFAYGDDDKQMSEGQLCQKAGDHLKKVS